MACTVNWQLAVVLVYWLGALGCTECAVCAGVGLGGELLGQGCTQICPGGYFWQQGGHVYSVHQQCIMCIIAASVDVDAGCQSGLQRLQLALAAMMRTCCVCLWMPA
jgi:hypothetical protein